jgi:hypothetical protein
VDTVRLLFLEHIKPAATAFGSVMDDVEKVEFG